MRVFLSALLALSIMTASASAADFGVAAAITKTWIEVNDVVSDGPVAQGEFLCDVEMDSTAAGLSTWGLTFGAKLAGTSGSAITGLSVQGWKVLRGIELIGGPQLEVWDSGITGETSSTLGLRGAFIFDVGEIPFEMGGFQTWGVSGTSDIASAGIYFGPRVTTQ